MEFHVLELPKLPQKLKEDSSDILLWAKFINAERKEEFDMLATKNPYIKSACQQLKVISQDKEKRLEYEAREKAVRDYNQLMLEAEERGKEIGKEIGKEMGGYEKAVSIVRNALRLHLSVNTIIEITGLSEKEIEDLQKEHNE